MRACIQRVAQASITVNRQVISHIDRGLVIFLGVGQGDLSSDAVEFAGKIARLRVFDDNEGRMNWSLVDTQGAMLCVSQFTLFGDCRKGRRPSFLSAARPEIAKPLYDTFVAAARQLGISVAAGVFRSQMQISLVNDGPVTLLLDSQGDF